MRWTRRIFATLFALAVIYALGRLYVVTFDSYVIDERVPYLQLQTPESMTIKWVSPETEIGSVRFGKEEADLSNKVSETEAVREHRVTLEGLQSGTRYYYNVFSPSMNIDNTDRWFYTQSDTNATLRQRIWVIGDSGKAGKHQQEVYKRAMKYIAADTEKPFIDYWLLLGDNAYTSGTQRQFNDALFNAYEEMIKHYVPHAINGNHDARRWAFYDIFDFPTDGQSGGIPSDTEQFYAIESGNVHIIMLDSQHGDFTPGSDLMQWLERDLKANRKPWCIVAFHHPPYSDGSHKSDHKHDSGGRLFAVRENAVPLLERYGVDLVLSGHSHGYERSHLIHDHTGTSESFDAARHIVDGDGREYRKRDKGTIYMVAGSSSKLNITSLQHPALPVGLNQMGSVLLDVTPESLTSRFIAIDGTIQDTFTLYKD